MHVRFAQVAALVLAAASSPGSAQDLGTYKAWRSHAFVEANERVCSMWSQPDKAQGKYTKRGEIFAFVTHRPDVSNKVSFEIGYDFKPGVALEVKIDRERYRLTTSGRTAWSDDAKTGEKMVRAMRAGKEMVVVGISKRGTKTTDTYSLSGFTAAHRAIGRACKQ